VWLADEIVRLAGEALESLQPASVGIGHGVARFAVNRRNNPSDNLHQLPELAGPGDHDVPVFRITDEHGELVAVLFGYACHPTVQSGLHWSGDYPGFAQQAIEEELEGVTALFFQGAGADQNPLPRGHDSWARQYGETLAAAVLGTLDREMEPVQPELGLAYRELDLPIAPLPSDEVLASRAESDNYIGRWARRMQKLKASGEEFPTHYPFPIQVWRLGEVPVIGLGGELVSGYAISLKEIFGFDTVVMGYSNDVMNYIPTTRILLEGGYEGLTAHMVYGLHGPWTGEVEASILHAVIGLAAEAGVRPVNHPTGKN
ncbi:MAG: neutral/alkaline non-lysosomal ceramidase N-terminal domain-containing protein, partial [Bacteroidota bacterium]